MPKKTPCQDDDALTDSIDAELNSLEQHIEMFIRDLKTTAVVSNLSVEDPKKALEAFAAIALIQEQVTQQRETARVLRQAYELWVPSSKPATTRQELLH